MLQPGCMGEAPFHGWPHARSLRCKRVGAGRRPRQNQLNAPMRGSGLSATGTAPPAPRNMLATEQPSPRRFAQEGTNLFNTATSYLSRNGSGEPLGANAPAGVHGRSPMPRLATHAVSPLQARRRRSAATPEPVERADAGLGAGKWGKDIAFRRGVVSSSSDQRVDIEGRYYGRMSKAE
jgi:hypothetical protein